MTTTNVTKKSSRILREAARITLSTKYGKLILRVRMDLFYFKWYLSHYIGFSGSNSESENAYTKGKFS
jgi:hypothetical protein